MSHYLSFSIIGAHIKNAEIEIGSMIEVEPLKREDCFYGEIEEKVFNENIQHGILAIYSINAAIESIVAMLNTKLGYHKNKFYPRVYFMIKKNIISDIKAYNKCIELRDIRNAITHWEESGCQLLSTMGYSPFMFGNLEAKKDDEKLISILNKKSMEDYLNHFNMLLDNIIKNLQEKGKFANDETFRHALKCIRQGKLEFEAFLG
jgi:antitoxin component YwqK of YwqJK toxin-antitoxin module